MVVNDEVVDIDVLLEGKMGSVPAVSFFNQILLQAIERRASDIHIEPREHDAAVRLRVDGVLQPYLPIEKEVMSALVSRIKVLAHMDIAEKRLPQDGRIQVRGHGSDIDLRVSCMPTVFGEKIVLRLLDRNARLFSLAQLGFDNQTLELYRHLFNLPHGMVIVAGPTGSGKTTTLYATLREIDVVHRNVVTIEDPVEYVMDGVSQVWVNYKTGLDFPTALRGILRQDPDVIMVGEIRDPETADIAVQAAITGHLILSTIHTNDAASAVVRLMDMGIEPFRIASALNGVMAQRLVRKLCGCREMVGQAYKANGCPKCYYSGYMGRTAISEIMAVGPEVKELILKRRPSQEIKEVAVAQGMVDLWADGLKKVAGGITSAEELVRVIPAT
ncbi:MAG: type II/IV secretion system protein [Clostridia bacterium]|nr:type II/IV secretion system protein [Clostridia bacterium]